MTVIPQNELRNNVAEVLRRAESGEQIIVTVAGRAVAQLGPTDSRRWISGVTLQQVWTTRAPHGLEADLAYFTGNLTDPFA